MHHKVDMEKTSYFVLAEIQIFIGCSTNEQTSMMFHLYSLRKENKYFVYFFIVRNDYRNSAEHHSLQQELIRIYGVTL